MNRDDMKRKTAPTLNPNEVTCENCEIRKRYAKCFDVHFDWRDCPYSCKYANEQAKEEAEKERRMTFSANYVPCVHRMPCGLCDIKKEACTYVYNSCDEIFREWPVNPSKELFGWWDTDKTTCTAERSEDPSHPFADSVMMGRIDEQRRHESIEGDREV